MVADYSVKGGAFDSGKPRPWADHPERKVNQVYSGPRVFDVSPDGKYLVVVAEERGEGAKESVHMTVLVNWFDELRRRTQGVLPWGSK